MLHRVRRRATFFSFIFFQVGFVEECSLGSTVVGNLGKEIAHPKPSRSFQAVYDDGNQSKGTIQSYDTCDSICHFFR